MCDHNSSEQKRCSAKEGGSSRCKHGHRRSTGSSGANRRGSKRNSTEERNQNPKSSVSAAENNTSFSQSQDIQRVGSFGRDSASTKELVSERAFGSSETTLKTGNEINIVQVPNAEVDNIVLQECDDQFMAQRRSSSSQRKNSAQPENFYQNQEENPCSSFPQGNSMMNEPTADNYNQEIFNNEPPIENCRPTSPETFGRRSSIEKKRCSFKLPASVCNVPDECESTTQESCFPNQYDDCENYQGNFSNQDSINVEEECEDQMYDYDESGKRGTYKKIKFRKNPTTVTNLREKIQQYVRNRPDQMKPAPEKLTPFSDPIFTKCFEPVDEELERQLREEKEAARRLMEQRKLEAEMQCYKKVIPFSLPCKTQLEYLDCLGASNAARAKYMEYSKLMKEADSYKKRMPSDWNCQQQMDYLDCMGVSEEVKQVLACSDEQQQQANRQSLCGKNSSFAAQGSFNQNVQQKGFEPSSFSAPASSYSANQNQGNDYEHLSFNAPTSSYSVNQNQEQDDIGDMIEKCKSEFRSSGLSVPRPPTSCKNAANQRQPSVDDSRRRSSSLSKSKEFFAEKISTNGSRVGGRESSNYAGERSSSLYANEAENYANSYNVTGERRSSDVTGDKKSYSITGDKKSYSITGERNSYDVPGGKRNSDAMDGRKSSNVNNYSFQVDQMTSGSKPFASFQQGASYVEEDYEEDPSDTESDLNHPMFGKQSEAPPPTLAEEMKLYKNHLANIRKRYFGALCKEMENADVITPDIAAAMVYSGELGISMKAAPEKVYDFLYPDAPGNQTISIAEVMGNLPKGLDDIVVPIVPPITLESRNYPDMEDPAMLDSPRVIQVGPALNLIDEPEVKGLLDPVDIKELVTGHTSANYLELMFPEMADMELEEEEEENEEKAMEKAREEMFNIKLIESMPQHFSQVQMRGTIPPNWFPGYWSASPSREGVWKSSKPSEVMEYIWEEMQPERVRPAGAAYIIGN